MAALVAERGELFGEIDVLDAGLLRTYTGFIVQFAVDGIEYFSGWPSKLQGSIPPVPSEFNVSQVREPIGVVGLIMPWNGPTAVFAMVAAALAAGNSVVLKPAEQTPMAAVLMAEVALDAGLPPGVFNVVQGTGRDVGQALVEHPEVDAISFTGSVATGSAIQAAAAKRRQAGVARTRRQEPVHRVPRRRPRHRRGDVDVRGVGRVGTGVHLRHSRAGARVDLRRLGQPHRRRHARTCKIGPAHGSDIGDGSRRVGQPSSSGSRSYVAIGQEEGAEMVLGGHQVGDRGYFHEPTSSPACATTCASPRRRSSGR